MPATLQGLARAFAHMQAKHRAIAGALGGVRGADPAEALVRELQASAETLASLLRNPQRVRIDLVTLPEVMAVEETMDAARELAARGMRVAGVIVNRVLPRPPQRCRWCEGRRDIERETMAGLNDAFTRFADELHEPQLQTLDLDLKVLNDALRHDLQDARR